MEDNGSGFIKTGMAEAVKTFSVYDGQFRLTDFYTAPTSAVNGTPCLRTQYAYDSTSTRVLKTKESKALWDSTWDMP